MAYAASTFTVGNEYNSSGILAHSSHSWTIFEGTIKRKGMTGLVGLRRSQFRIDSGHEGYQSPLHTCYGVVLGNAQTRNNPARNVWVNGTIHKVVPIRTMFPSSPVAARPPSPTLRRSSPYVRRSLLSMSVILGMLLLDEHMKLKMHSTGSCLKVGNTGIPTSCQQTRESSGLPQQVSESCKGPCEGNVSHRKTNLM